MTQYTSQMFQQEKFWYKNVMQMTTEIQEQMMRVKLEVQCGVKLEA